MTQRNGGQIIVDALRANGVGYAAGVCGHGVLGLLDAFYDVQDEIQVISTHHESVAGFMADAYYRVLHRPMAAFASCGPGALNLPVAVAAAQADSSAVLAITGNVPTQQWNRGPFQESGQHFQGDFVNAMRPYVKRSFQATRADMLPYTMRRAFGLMREGKPGPVHVDVPLNVFVETAETDDAELVAGTVPIAPAAPAEAVRRVHELIAAAARPVIVAGHGVAVGAAEAVLAEFAELVGVPLATTPAGKSVFPGDHPLALGCIGRNGTLAANGAARNADLVIAIGTRFDDRTTSSWLPGYTFEIPPTRLVHIDVNPAELGRNYPADVAIVADAATVLRQLLEAAPTGRAPDRAAWLRTIAGWRDTWAKATADAPESRHGAHPRTAIAEISRALPDDAILLADVGAHHNWMVSDFPVHAGRSFLQSWGFAAMGFGVAGVLGAKLAAPDRTAVTVCGDGGFLMTSSAVATAVEYELPAIWIVWNNGGYVSIRDQQRGFFGADRQLATSFLNADGSPYSADYAGMARAMGAEGRRLDDAGDLAGALAEAVESGRPTVLDLAIDPEAVQASSAGWSLPPLASPPPSVGWGSDGALP